MIITFLSIDSSLSNTGIAFGEIENGMIKSIQGISLCETQKTKNKQIRASSDTINRCRETYRFVQHAIKAFNPSVVFVETPSGSQSSNGMKSYGTTCQLIASITPDPIEVTPEEVKRASVGRKDASKRDIINWAYKLYPSLQWYVYRENLQDKNEHMADAIAIAYAAIKTSDFIRLTSLTNHD